MSEVKIFTFNYQIDGLPYGGQIPARSWDDAQTLVPFAVIDGELVAEIPYDDDHRFMMVIPSKPYQVH